MKYVWTFLGLFIVGFIVGIIHAIQDNSVQKDVNEIIDQISSNLTLEAGDTSSWINYKCKSENQASISFETLKVKTDPNFEFKDKKTTLPFMSFDRLYATIGGGLLLSWSIKDVFKSGSENKDKITFASAILGAVSGYSLGYYIFKNDKLDCASTQVEEIFSNKDKLEKLKKRVVAQVLISDVLLCKKNDSLKCFYLGKISFEKLLNYIDVYNMSKDTAFSKQFIYTQKKYELSYMKLWNDSINLFKTSDLNNIRVRIDLLKKLFATKQFLSKEFTEYKLSPVTELNKEQLKRLLNGS